MFAQLRRPVNFVRPTALHKVGRGRCERVRENKKLEQGMSHKAESNIGDWSNSVQLNHEHTYRHRRSNRTLYKLNLRAILSDSFNFDVRDNYQEA